MPIEDLAYRYRELGRLKFGEDLGDRPSQLETWRLTSPSAFLIETAAQLWGGTVTRTEKGAEVTTDADELEVLIPPQDVQAGQFYELWKAGGLERRCTGTALIEFDDSPAGYSKIAPCLCDEENSAERACRISTTLRVLLPQLPDIGVWRLYTRSLYAASEIPATIQILERIAGPTGIAPAVLGLEKRSSKKKGSARHNYVVPVLRTRTSLEALMASPGAAGLEPLPFPEAPAEKIAPPLPQGIPPSPPAPPPQSHEKPSEAPVEAPAPERPVSAHTERSRALWRELARFLEQTPPGEAPLDREILIEILTQLEKLTLETGLWHGDPLDAASNRYLRGRYWRGDQVETEELRSFAQRALMAAANDLQNHRAGQKILAGEGETQ